jgi:deoxyribodipyrimidine photolyase-related protein
VVPSSPPIPAVPPGGRLLIVLGDQLDTEAPVLRALDTRTDIVFMAEVPAESTRIPSHAARTLCFFAAMRHHARALQQRGFAVDYGRLGHHRFATLGDALGDALTRHRPQQILCVWPGDHQVKSELEAAATAFGLAIDWQTDTHFLTRPEDFAAFARDRKVLRLEHWYRQVRRRTRILMDGEQPVGGEWNFDASNRGAFTAAGPGFLPAPTPFEPDDLTREAEADVRTWLPALPGSLDHFAWPVTRQDALVALRDFIEHRLPLFGVYQDAMWHGETTLYHSRLSAALNLKLLNPREVVDAAVAALHRGHAPLPAVEGFVRQIIGWREYVRGLYWWRMPAYADSNHLEADEPLPEIYWTGDTEYACLADTLRHTLDHGYAHHIERLMVIGLFTLLLGVRPREVHQWFLGMYVDAVEWVELPNVIGMSQYADGGAMASKPYIASGRYIERMSNYCDRCPKRPGEATGPRACPYTTLYWDFLARHRDRFVNHPRLGQQVRNFDARPDSARQAVREAADALRQSLRRHTEDIA